MLSRVYQVDNDADARANHQQEKQPAVAIEIDHDGKRIRRLITGFVSNFNSSVNIFMS